MSKEQLSTNSKKDTRIGLPKSVRQVGSLFLRRVGFLVLSFLGALFIFYDFKLLNNFQWIPYALTVTVVLLLIIAFYLLGKYFHKPSIKIGSEQVSGNDMVRETFLLTFLTAIGGILGAVLLYHQNKLLENQNRMIDIQIVLQEANRRSSYGVILGNLLDKIDRELDSTNRQDSLRKLSPQLIARINSICQSFKPYRFLDEDSLIVPLPRLRCFAKNNWGCVL